MVDQWWQIAWYDPNEHEYHVKTIKDYKEAIEAYQKFFKDVLDEDEDVSWVSLSKICLESDEMLQYRGIQYDDKAMEF